MNTTCLTTKKRLLIIQWRGDYREAYQRLAEGGGETYYAQRYSVESAGDLAQQHDAVGVMCLGGTPRFDETMPNGVRAMSAGSDSRAVDYSAAFELMVAFRPSHLILTTPDHVLLRQALAQGVQVLPVFADIFLPATFGLPMSRRLIKTLKHIVSSRRLARSLNDRRIRFVGNHNINACLNLVKIGVAARKVIPWDWPPIVKPTDYEPKDLKADRDDWSLVFVGAMVQEKGVGEAIHALAELRRRGMPVRLRLIGRGDLEKFRRAAQESDVSPFVDFAGPQSHSNVLAAVRAADLALVPSWHAYPEGLPMTIYEALAVRTPVICSDHPAFRGRVGDGLSSVCVPERSGIAIADAVEALLMDPRRYRRMSEQTAVTWSKLVCPVTMYELIRRWAADTAECDQWLSSHNINSGRYETKCDDTRVAPSKAGSLCG